jgi:hypothetical protein
MVKLKFITFNTNDVPDHILEEVTSLAAKLGESIHKIIKQNPPNISLAAMNILHTALIKHMVKETPEELMKAAKACAESLIRNMEITIEVMKKNELKDD